MLKLTPKAITKVKEFYRQDSAVNGKPLRISVKTGGCSSYQYTFNFEDKQEGDTVLALEGLTVLVDKTSAPLLKGCLVDFKEEFSGSGFSIKNPNAKSSCGCGESFDV